MAGTLLTDLGGALRMTMAEVGGLIVARTRFLASAAALAPCAQRRAIENNRTTRSQDISCALRITYAAQGFLFFAIPGHLEHRAVLVMKHSKIQELKKGS